LPDDLLAGTGLRIFQGVVLGIPIVGTWLSNMVFGGQFPGDVVARLYPVHVIIAPALLGLALLGRFWLALRDAPLTVRPGGGVVVPLRPRPWWPIGVVQLSAMVVITSGVIMVFGGLVEIAPVWRQGPSSPGAAGAGSQPDWYTAFLDGALRLVPSGWEIFLGGRTVTLAVIIPLLVTGVLVLGILAWPFVEELVTGDRAQHLQLDRAREARSRTAFGAAGLLCYGVLWAAGSADLIATQFSLSFNAVIAALQGALLIGPPLVFVITRMACGAIQQLERERRSHPPESGVIVRRPDGGYEELPLGQGAAPELTELTGPTELLTSPDSEQTKELKAS
jgi:ubiquinol-cytochrome c reductase cytochrome b subunit